MNAPPKVLKPIAQLDFLTAALCENLMAGRDMFAGFPGANAVPAPGCRPGGSSLPSRLEGFAASIPFAGEN